MSLKSGGNDRHAEDHQTYIAVVETGQGFWTERQQAGTLSRRDWHDSGPATVVAHSLTVPRGGPTTEDGTGRGVPIVAHSLTSEGHDASEDGTGRGTPLAYALNASHGTHLGQGHNTTYPGGVRRLTTTECCRLQSFPDDHLGEPNEQPDSPRYAAMGDAVTVNVAEWLGTRLKERA